MLKIVSNKVSTLKRYVYRNCKANEVLTFLGVRHIPHDEESGIDLKQLNENQRSIFIGLCLILLSPLAMIVLIYIHLDLYLGTLIMFPLHTKPD